MKGRKEMKKKQIKKVALRSDVLIRLLQGALELEGPEQLEAAEMAVVEYLTDRKNLTEISMEPEDAEKSEKKFAEYSNEKLIKETLKHAVNVSIFSNGIDHVNEMKKIKVEDFYCIILKSFLESLEVLLMEIWRRKFDE